MKPHIAYLIKHISPALVVGLITLNSSVPLSVCKCAKKACPKKIIIQKIISKPSPPPFSFFNDVVAPLFPALKI
jgi:hypothetical protein